MKREMSAFDVMRVVQEMQELVGGYLDKVFHWDRRNVLLRVNVPGSGRREVLLVDQNFLYVSKERPETPEAPSQFAVHLRKLLSNARITGVRQQEFDRVVLVDLQRDADYQIVIELFGEGNLLLVGEGRIVNCLVSKTWKHRDVRPGASYEFPPPRFNPRAHGLEEFKRAVLASRSDLVRTLATAVNLGGQYAEEVCLRAGIEKGRKASSLDDEALARLSECTVGLIEEAASATGGFVYLEAEGGMVDATPIPLRMYEGLEVRPFPTFSEALMAYVERRRRDQLETAGNPEVQRLTRQLRQLREAAERSEAEAGELVRKAEAVYSEYALVSSQLQRFSQLGGMDWDRARAEAKALGASSIDPERRMVGLVLGDLEVELDYTKSLEGNASLIYAQARELKDKAVRSRQLIIETESRIEALRHQDDIEAQRSKEEVKPTKAFWFEAYKWFITGGGHLVLAGRDARTNDQVVKKHLTSADRYAHADVHGAPSVVIKEGASASEEELAEACVFALAHSKAWNAGLREGSAYWVLPDQVSKTPEAGEFVPRGAFIIRGRRNYIHHIQMELALGEVDVQGARKVMCGPRSALASRSGWYVVLAPGERGKGRMSSSLAREFGVPEEEVSRILPPGDVEVRERYGPKEE